MALLYLPLRDSVGLISIKLSPPPFPVIRRILRFCRSYSVVSVVRSELLAVPSPVTQVADSTGCSCPPSPADRSLLHLPARPTGSSARGRTPPHGPIASHSDAPKTRWQHVEANCAIKLNQLDFKKKEIFDKYHFLVH